MAARSVWSRSRTLAVCGVLLIAITVAATAVLVSAPVRAEPALPAGFQDEVVLDGLKDPTNLEFSKDGRIFVAEKSGVIKVFDSISDTTPTTFADLSTNVYNFWDRGLLGLALAPNFPADPHVYVLYTYDAAIGGTAPRWGTEGVPSDPCPNPPGATANGCVVSGRLSSLTADGDKMTGSEKVLLEDWCQQYPSHSVGDLAFGADGALYVSAGDGASFSFADYGQDGSPPNPCGDPPGGVGARLSPPTAQGGALRAQDLSTSGDPLGFDGSLLRLDASTGKAFPDNPLIGSGNLKARRMVADGFRNPFRLSIRPGTSEVWTGDVGWTKSEEIDRVSSPADPPVENFGWPCYEGRGRQAGYDGANLRMCENLYSEGSGAVRQPYFSYDHTARVVPGESCPTGNSSVTGLDFYEGGAYPDSYDNALFFADYSRKCIWAMKAGAGGLPDPARTSTFVAGAANPVDLETGPGGDLYYADLAGGTIHRVKYNAANQPPVAHAAADPTNGSLPLRVRFDGSGSSDPDGDMVSYEWDFTSDGSVDATGATPSHTYKDAGRQVATLTVTDAAGARDSDTVELFPGDTPPEVTINQPVAGTTWRVGEKIPFSGSAADQEDGALAPSALTWSLILHHCSSASECHEHEVQDYSGVTSGSFVAPDHDYPAYLELRLEATDSAGLAITKSVRLDPETVKLRFTSSPTGAGMVVNSTKMRAPFSRTVIIGSNNSVSADSRYRWDGKTYYFHKWSDGKAQTHNIIAPGAATTYKATYALSP
jgi:glucose/arabinose dehydrogenase